MFSFWFISSTLLLITSASDSDIETPTQNELELLKFKNDLDDIGTVIENFFVDVVDEFVKRIPETDNFKTTIKPTSESTTENPTSTMIQEYTAKAPFIDNFMKKEIPLEITTISWKSVLESFNKNIADISEKTKASQNAATKIILDTINKANKILKNQTQLELTTISWKKMLDDVTKNIPDIIARTRPKRAVLNNNSETSEELPTKNESKVRKFKTDLDTIQSSIENLIYDLIDEAMKYLPTSKHIKDAIKRTKQNLSQTTLNNLIKKESPFETTTTSWKAMKKTIKKNRLKNYNKLKPAENAAAIVLDTLAKTQLKDYIRYNLTNKEKPFDKASWKKYLESVNKNISEVLEKPRYRRSIDNGPTLIDIPLTDNSQDLNTTASKPTETIECNTKTQADEIMERQHIEDLKEEVNKLHELVTLLRAQQKTMSILDKETQNIDDKLPARFNSRDLLKILEHLNNKHNDGKDLKPIGNTEIADSKAVGIEGRNGIENVLNTNVSTHMELNKIKTDLRNAIVALNRTREILAISREREFLLETELKRQQNELNLLRTLMEKLFQNKEISQTEELLGTPLHRKMSTLEIRNNRSRESNQVYRPQIHNTQQVPKSRASDLDELTIMLKDSSKPNIATQLKQLQIEMEKEKRRKLLESLLNQDKESKSLNSLDTDDSDFIKKLEIALKEANQPQSKSDSSVERELAKLQVSINKLRPRDGLDLDASSNIQLSEEEKLNILLKRLNEVNSKNLESKSLQNLQQLTPTQIFALKNKIDQIAESMGGNKNMYSVNGGIVPASFDFRKGPMPYSNMAGRYKNPVPVSPYKNQPYPTADVANYGYDKSRIYGFSYPGENVYNSYTTPYTSNMGANSGYNNRIFTNNYGANANALSNRAYGMYNGYVANGDNRPNDYGTQPINTKPYGDLPKPLPYTLGPAGNQFYPQMNQGYAQVDQRNQFFRDPQPNVYDPPIPNDSYPQDNLNAGDPSQPEAYPAEGPGDANYKTRSIDNLKYQVSSLQNIVNGFNHPGYVHKPEDQQMVSNLEAQISKLEGIINAMSQETPPNPAYNQNPPNYEQTNISPPNYDHPVSKRSIKNKEHQVNKRSANSNEIDSGSNLFDQVTSKLRDIIFHDQSPQERSAFSDMQDRIMKLKTQV